MVKIKDTQATSYRVQKKKKKIADPQRCHILEQSSTEYESSMFEVLTEMRQNI